MSETYKNIGKVIVIIILMTIAVYMGIVAKYDWDKANETGKPQVLVKFDDKNIIVEFKALVKYSPSTPCVVDSKGFKNYFKEEGLKVKITTEEKAKEIEKSICEVCTLEENVIKELEREVRRGEIRNKLLAKVITSLIDNQIENEEYIKDLQEK